jgi:branched-subunit amino acid transport protein
MGGAPDAADRNRAEWRPIIVSEAALWVLILVMGAVTVSMRASFVLLQDRVRLPDLVRRGMNYVPAAVLAAIVAPAFIQVGGEFDLALQAPRWAAGVVGTAVAWRTRHMVAVLAAGMLTLWAAQALMR